DVSERGARSTRGREAQRLRVRRREINSWSDYDSVSATPRFNDGPAWIRCPDCEDAGRLLNEGVPKRRGGALRGSSRRVSGVYVASWGCETCGGKGGWFETRRDPYSDRPQTSG